MIPREPEHLRVKFNWSKMMQSPARVAAAPQSLIAEMPPGINPQNCSDVISSEAPLSVSSS